MKKLLILISLFILICLLTTDIKAQQAPDTTGLPLISKPFYENGLGSLICIDAAHNNFHRLSTGFAPFALFLKSDGYQVNSNENDFEDGIPESCEILVISNPLHQSNVRNWISPTPSAFTEEEIKQLEAWVHNGGSLFLIADHMPFPGATKKLAAAFGVTFNNGFAMKEVQTWPPAVFRKTDGTLGDSPITKEIDSVATYTGQAFQIPNEATSVLTFADDHFTLMPDTAWSFGAHTPYESVKGWSQGAILKYGKGKLAVFGEAAMFTAQNAGIRKVGITDPNAPQNAQFLLNIIHWLDSRITESQ